MRCKFASGSTGRRSFLLTRAVNQTENHRHEKQSNKPPETQSADYRAAQRSILFTALSQTDRHGQHTDDHGERRHDYRTETGETRLQRSFVGGLSLFEPLFRKADDQDAIRRGDSHAHDRAGKGGHADGSARDEQEPDDSRKRARQSHQDDERIEPGLEIHDDEQINENNRKREPPEQARKRRIHGQNLAADDELRAPWQVLLVFLDDRVDLARKTSQIASLYGAENVDDRLDV